MLYNSIEFIFLFMPVVLFVYYILAAKVRYVILAKAALVLFSLIYYSMGGIMHLPVIVISILMNFLICKQIITSQKKEYGKRLLTIGISLNILCLAYFKYTDFFLENIGVLLSVDIPLARITLPLGISFFTFQQVAYLVDAYNKKVRENNFLNYCLFVSFFPQLIAGPIVHHSEMMPQFSRLRNMLPNYSNLSKGLTYFSIGLFKKVMIADVFAAWATSGFNNATDLTFIAAWATSLSYTFQIYFDFSGYMDMALGIALMFNIRLPFNFFSPYRSLNIREFWQTWHITLGRFLRDYVYIPLGGNSSSLFVTCRNLFITFVIGGIWHGAGWPFLVWGALHGIAVFCHRIWVEKFNLKLNAIFSWIITFNFINITWIFFRAEDYSTAVKILKGMLGFNGLVLPYELSGVIGPWVEQLNQVSFGSIFLLIGGDLMTLAYLAGGFAFIFLPNSHDIVAKYKPNVLYFLFIFFTLVIAALNIRSYSEFLYFRF
jgi:D-alanyl-lipoteichoic acid acyltransferase DltB (MBOAT superfamily)